MRATAVTVGLVGALAGCSGSVTSSPPRKLSHPVGTSTTLAVPTTTAGPGATSTSTGPGIASGTYTNGSQGTPLYVLTLHVDTPGGVSGNLAFIYQDGRQSTVWTFTGGTNAGATELTTSTGMRVSAVLSPDAVQLPGCAGYLQYATSANACTFTPGTG